MRKAVHFGAGNIGRGFIGLLLSQSGYELTFVDINPELINAINTYKEYTVRIVSEKCEELKVTGIQGLMSSQEDQVTKAIASSEIVTTAVGPKVLKNLAPTIALALRLKITENLTQPLNIIACENMIGASESLKEEVFKHLQPEEITKLKNIVGFPNAAVDRIVPPEDDSNDLLSVSVEPYFEWVVNKNGFVPPIPSIKGMQVVTNLEAYVQRKIFTLNTGHAIAAYLGYVKGYRTIREALEDQQVYKIVKGAMEESGKYLIHRFGFSPKEHSEYIEKTLERFQNPYLEDSVVRVARQPIRKLGPQDRLVFPAKEALRIGVTPRNISKGIAAALKFDWQGDEEAVVLQAMIKEKGVKKVIAQICDISGNSVLSEMIVEEFNKMS